MPRSYEEVKFLTESLGFRCTPKFAEPLMSDARERILFGGWRASKTVRDCLIGMLYIMDWYHEHLENRGRRRLIWLVGPDYKQTAEEYRYLGEWLGRLQMLVAPPSIAMEGPRQLTLSCNVVIETKSADHPETLASVAPDLILACEPGQMSDTVRDMLQGRSLEKNCPIVWGGTVEDDEGHATWAWYQETARLWLDNPTDRHQAWSLPTWDNPLFYSCQAWIDEDPSLAQFCPQDGSPHGEAHGGRLHPVIHQFEVPSELGGKGYDGYTFAQRIAAIPTGPQFTIYPQTIANSLLLPVPQTAIRGFYASTGGLDYGTVHPSALAVVQFTDDPRDRQDSFVGPRGIAWVREVRYLQDGGDAHALQIARKELSEKWRCYRWNLDPMQSYMAKDFDPELVGTSYSESRREARIGLVTGRLNYRKLFFDMDGPGVPRTYEEFKHYHRRKTRTGKMEVVRDREDGVAAVEDAIEAYDGEPHLSLPRGLSRSRPARRQPSYARRV